MNWKIILASLGHFEMRKRILAVLGILFVFRVLALIPIPLEDPQTLKQVLDNLFQQTGQNNLLGFLNVLSGGALANFSIVLIGLGPYINASIIMQLLTKAVPKLEAMHKEGEYGRKRINQYTRMLTLPLAVVQDSQSVLDLATPMGSAREHEGRSDHDGERCPLSLLALGVSHNQPQSP